MRGAIGLALLMLVALHAGDGASAADRSPLVVDGRLSIDRADLTAGTAIAAGATVTAASLADVRMVDGTILALKPDTVVVFTGAQNDGSYRLRIERGEISLDSSKRLPATHAVWYRITTPLHTLVSFLSTQGTIVVGSNGDRVVCKACSRGDFLVASFDNSVALSQPGQVAQVTAEGGLQGGVLLPAAAAAPGSGSGALAPIRAAPPADVWIVRSLVVSVRSGGGDHPSIAPCPGVPVRLRVVGATAPVTFAPADPSAATVTPGSAPLIFELRATGATDVAVSDAAGLTARIAVATKAATACRSDVPPGPE